MKTIQCRPKQAVKHSPPTPSDPASHRAAAAWREHERQAPARSPREQGSLRKIAAIAGWTGLLLTLAAVLGPHTVNAQSVLTFDVNDNGKTSFTRTVDGVTATFSNQRIQTNFQIANFTNFNGPAQLFLSPARSWDVAFDAPVTLTEYQLGPSFGNERINVTGPGIAGSFGNSPDEGTHSFVSGPLSLQANTPYTFSRDGQFFGNISFFESLTFLGPAPPPPPPPPPPSDPGAGQLAGSLTRIGIQATSFMLGGTVDQILGLGGVAGCMDVAVAEFPADVLPVSFQANAPFGGLEAGDGTTVRAQGGGMSGWEGWSRGYGTGGNVNGSAVAPGLDYGSGGTQVGIHRRLSDGTRFGLFGGYGYQHVDSTADQTANVNSGQFGAFMLRRDDCGNYYLLLVNGGRDDYVSRRETATGVARGDFGGGQTATYLQRGWAIPYGSLLFQPTAAVQHIYLHQDAFTETGAGLNNTAVGSIDEHSLRSLLGGRISALRCTSLGMLTPSARAHWMHEYLDTSTTAGLAIGGAAATTTQGVDLGRNFAVVGVGTSLAYSSCLTLYANYDCYVNGRTDFHVGSGGVQWIW
jgi:uncharacterized protein YhjY with autotransporter beta-barrel domain